MGIFYRIALLLVAFSLVLYSVDTNAAAPVKASEDALPFAILPAHKFETITPEQLSALNPFPVEYGSLPANEQLQWVEEQLAQATTPSLQYILLQERAYLLIIENNLIAVQQQCRLHAPLTFDFRYRLRCLVVATYDYDTSVIRWLDLYEDAIAEDNFNVGTQALARLGWLQSERGHIAQAFSTYQRALEYVDQVNFLTTNDVLSNTASLYIMHGDETYIERGIELHQQTITRLNERMQAYPEEAHLHARSIAIVHHNLGVTYALHLHDYPTAVEWFARVPEHFEQMYIGATIFSALAAAYAEQPEQAQQYLARSYQLTPIDSGFEYLLCYRQLTAVFLGLSDDVPVCKNLAESTPLEVQIDIYQRMAQLTPEHVRTAGLELFHTLYNDKLEAQLKQSSSLAASATELSRLQQEAHLQRELFEREQQLAQAEQQRRDGQIRLALASTVILLLILVLITLRFHQNRKLAAQFQSLSVRDSLTGLHNRRFFEQNIAREMSLVSYANQSGHPTQLALIILDIDYFKEFNDNHGHQAGDKALQAFARRVEGAIRPADMLVRWGGEEFVIIARLERNEDYDVIADRILERVSSEPFTIDGNKQARLTCTLGAAICPDCDELDRQSLMQLADAALYYGKQQGRNRWVCVEAVPRPEQLNLKDGALFSFESAIQQGHLKIRTSS